MITWILIFIIAFTRFTTSQNGLGYKTPPMGWNPYNAFINAYNETLIKQHADIIANQGYLAVGYRYINLDDGWQASERTKDNKLSPDSLKFPSGIKDLADYMHKNGLLFGIFSDAGTQTCGGHPGSLDYEDTDAQTFVDWDVDYLKYDICDEQRRPEQELYQKMGNALKNATAGKNKTIFYNICEWRTSNPWLWGPDAGGNSWRTSLDIIPFWPSIISIIDSQVRLTEYGESRRGWNDPDMLVLGFDRIPYEEQVTHYAFWAAMKAPLILGCDLRKVDDKIKALILNKDIISVNQDPLGLSVCQVYYRTDNKSSFDIWTGPLNDGYAAILFNRGIEPISITLDFKEHCHLNGSIEVYDLVKQQTYRGYTNNYTAVDIPEHGVEFIKLIGGNRIDDNRPCLNYS
ncbi:Glycoside Hydrolase Family 27 protein [Gigaspora rosea]|uniref:Alpha-galactosidase n=1 Tax=Gigaspora rosea TaxID=44941 RepID=A0A397VF19_9GLOM|nr:Glycoside Hydrolase Family 27 protein [Gigaspora rosea]